MINSDFEIEARRAFMQSFVPTLGDLSEKTPEEVERIATFAAERAKQLVYSKKANDDERKREDISVRVKREIIDRNRPIRYGTPPDPLPMERQKVESIIQLNAVETQRKILADELKALEDFNREGELANWLKETEIPRKEHPDSAPQERDFLAGLDELESIRQHAIPIWKERIRLYVQRIAELKKAEIAIRPLINQANQITNKALKLVEEESRLIDKLCEADNFGREREVDELLKPYRQFSGKISEINTEHQKVLTQIAKFRIQPIGLLPFPERKTIKLKSHDRILRKLMT